MFIEKYRPQNIDDIILEDSIKSVIKNYLATDNMPNLLLYSPSPGTGKTSLSKIIVSSLQSEFIEINASNARGIDIVREKIEPFIMFKSFNNKRKAILLSECEQLTTTSQKALKDLLEGRAMNNVYYILTTNDKNKIIKPIISRCVELDFSFPPKDKILQKLKVISLYEAIKLEEPDLISVVDAFYPDIRKMLNTLEKIASGIKIEDAVGSEISFYDLSKLIVYKKVKAKDFYKKLETIPIIPFCHYLFKAFMNNPKIVKSAVNTIKDIYLGIDEKMAFINNFFEL